MGESHLPLPQYLLMSPSHTIRYICQHSEIKVGMFPLAELQSLSGCHQLLCEWPSSVQRPHPGPPMAFSHHVSVAIHQSVLVFHDLGGVGNIGRYVMD